MCLIVCTLGSVPAAHAEPVSRSSEAYAAHVRTAFFYGPNVPAELLDHYDRVVVEPDNIGALAPPSKAQSPGGAGRAPGQTSGAKLAQSPADVLAKVPLPRAELFAYVSLGEVHPSRAYHRDVPLAWILGRNGEYGADVIDVSRADWRAFALDRILEPLYQKGYRGFFLDTLESYKQFAPQNRWDADVAGLAFIVRGFSQRHPDAKILLNRGFELLPQVWSNVAGVVAESLFNTYRVQGKTRRAELTPPRDRDILLAKLREAQTRYRAPVTVIDYIPASAGVEARKEAARRSLALGFAPYVTGFDLDEIGVGEVEIIPRRVLLIHKGDDEGFLGVQDANVLIAPVLEWMGYRVDYLDVRKALPTHNLAGQYAGIVVFLPDGAANEGALERFLGKQLDAGYKIAFIEGFGFTPNERFLRRLGLASAPMEAKAPLTIVPPPDGKPSPYLGFEAKPRAHVRELSPVNLGLNAQATNTKTFLHLQDDNHQQWDGVVTGSWGGAAFFPYVLEEGLEGDRRWILDPFRFLHDALNLPDIPMADVTTESGRRELTIHVDGDAFPSLAERKGYPYAGKVVLDELLRVYKVPTTVSVVEGEVGPKGRYPEKSPALERIAKDIFRLPNVEVASHTYSHPFFWADAEAGKTAPHGIEPVHLPIPGYKFSLERDITGSVDYIEKRLSPPEKKVMVLQWPGDCEPSGAAVAMTENIGVYNVNGGGATRSFETPSLTRGSAMGIPDDNGAYQVFAPVENENVYTNDFLGPYYGYRRAIETFKLNDSPRRLSHISIYYHFYSATKTAALTALKEVYDWALQQESIPLYLSDYAMKVLGFNRMTIARGIDPGSPWEIEQNGALTTLRLNAAWGFPDLGKSTGVAGLRDVPQGRYVSLVPGEKVSLVQRSAAPEGVYLEQANGQIKSWVREARGARLRIKGYMPLVITIGGVRRSNERATCVLRYEGGSKEAKGVPSPSGGVSFTLKETDTGESHLECQ